MQHFSKFQIVSVGIAIFSMFFGAGNIVYPLIIGMTSGTQVIFGLVGFLLATVCLPLIGLVAMILFDGNYGAFFERLGSERLRDMAVFISMLIIGPVIAIPRIVTLSHVMIAPFLPIAYLQTISIGSSFLFALMFLGATFLAAFKESKLILVLGNVIGPIKVISLAIIMIKGCLIAPEIMHKITGLTDFAVFKAAFVDGFGTLDLLGAIFFSSMVLHLLKDGVRGQNVSHKELALVGLQAGLIGVGLLAVMYTGMTFLGSYHGQGLEGVGAGELFQIISFNVMGAGGAIIIALAVLMSCLSTSIALSAVFAEYLQRIAPCKVSFGVALAVGVLLCLPLSCFGLDYVLRLAAGPIVQIGYPVLITLTFCNVAYKWFGFTPVRVPVLITLLVAVLNYMR